MSEDITVSKKEMNGYYFLDIEYSEPVTMALCLGEERKILKGRFAIAIVKGRREIEDEIQFCFYMRKNSPILREKRNPHIKDCVEMYLPLKIGREIIKKALYAIYKDQSK